MLADAKSEKGEGFFSYPTRWRAESIFGAVDDICRTANRTALRAGWQELGLRLGAYPLVVCDDDAKEIADFIALDPEEKRIASVHAKANKGGTGTYNVDSLQAVGRQATASLAFLARYAPVGNWRAERWPTDVRGNKVSLTGRNRIFKNTGALNAQQISDTLAAACGNPTYDREVWIVAGNMVDRSAVAGHILADTMDNRLRQFLMHWDGLRTACARAGARLLLFCPESRTVGSAAQGEDGDISGEPHHRLNLAMGLAPDPAMGRISSGPPGVHTGNLDNKDLVTGTTLYISVHAPGALFSAGDAHAAQGHGEVDLTAIETGLRGKFQFTVRKDMKLT
jgi:Acetamidase/Formamidase family